MKALFAPLFTRYAERIDAASLRERGLIFAAAALVVIFLANAVLLEPLRAKQRRLAAEETKRQQEISALAAQSLKLAQAAQQDPRAEQRRQQAALRLELQKLSAAIEKEHRRFTSPERMRSVLDEFLQRNRRLTLVELKTLPATALAGSGASAALYRHGMEVTVSGNYLDLHDYLKALEGSATQLYWGRADFAVSEYPTSTLKFTVYTVSLDRTWLIV